MYECVPLDLTGRDQAGQVFQRIRLHECMGVAGAFDDVHAEHIEASTGVAGSGAA
jgi:hypothetical protein